MKKQFIAGARCPQCGQEDKIFVYHKDDNDIAECNACGYQSIRPKDDDPVVHPDDEVAKPVVIQIRPKSGS